MNKRPYLDNRTKGGFAVISNQRKGVLCMDGMNGINGMEEPFAGSFWGLPVAFAMEDDALARISSMSDEKRALLREKSKQVKSEKEMDELVRMVAEGKFE